MLIDLLDLVGLDALAQVDLGERLHRHQGTEALGRMSAQIMVTAWARLHRRGLVAEPTPPNTVLTQFRRGGQDVLPNLDREIASHRHLRRRAAAAAHHGTARHRPATGGLGVKVLMNAGPWLPVPPRGYGGIENIVATLVPELRRLGVTVVLATVAESSLPVDETISVFGTGQFGALQRPYNQVSGVAQAHLHGIVRALRRRDDIDLIHDHLEAAGLATFAALGDYAPPVLHTLHWDLHKHPELYGTFDGGDRVRVNGVSASQLARAPRALRDARDRSRAPGDTTGRGRRPPGTGRQGRPRAGPGPDQRR